MKLIFEAEVGFGLQVAHANTSSITIQNFHSVDNGDLSNETPPRIYYAIVIFHEADYTGGIGL